MTNVSGFRMRSPLRRATLAFGAIVALFAAVTVTGGVYAVSDHDWTVLARAGAASWRTGAGEGGWQDLRTNARVPDSAQIRTGSSGHAVVARSLDRIEVHPNSTVVVTARNSGNGTMEIYQDSGSATYTIEKRPAGTFAVRTPYVVAVVKGTRFTVEISEAKTTVAVMEGVVAVSDRRSGDAVDVLPGETASSVVGSPGIDVSHVDADAGIPGPGTGGGTGSAGSGAGATDATGAVGSTVDAVAGAVEGVGDTVEGVVGGIGSTVGRTAEDVGGTVGDVVDGVAGGLGDIGGGDSGGNGGSGGGGDAGGGDAGGGDAGGGDAGGGDAGGGDSGGGDSGGGDSGGGDSGGGDSGGGGSDGGDSGGGGLGGAVGDAVGGLL